MVASHTTACLLRAIRSFGSSLLLVAILLYLGLHATQIWSAQDYIQAINIVNELFCRLPVHGACQPPKFAALHREHPPLSSVFASETPLLGSCSLSTPCVVLHCVHAPISLLPKTAPRGLLSCATDVPVWLAQLQQYHLLICWFMGFVHPNCSFCTSIGLLLGRIAMWFVFLGCDLCCVCLLDHS